MLARLTEALDGIDRLVLLGDLIELRQAPARSALAVAEPVLGELGRALGPYREVVIVPGNHDHRLLDAWTASRSLDGSASPLRLESPVLWREGELLGRVAAALAPAPVRVSYPGLWLRDDVYAMHGHYGDLHTTVPMFERLGAGVMARVAGPAGRDPRRAEDYEAVLAPLYAWVDAVAERRGALNGTATAGRHVSHSPSTRVWRTLQRPGPRRVLLGGGLVAGVALLSRAIGPLRGDLSGEELRRAGLRACGEVVSRLGIEARWVVFGHTHRAGPLPGDDLAEWSAPTGAALVNTGCWVQERAFLGSRPSQSPYRAGFAVRVTESGPPELVNLLD